MVVCESLTAVSLSPLVHRDFRAIFDWGGRDAELAQLLTNLCVELL